MPLNFLAQRLERRHGQRRRFLIGGLLAAGAPVAAMWVLQSVLQRQVDEQELRLRRLRAADEGRADLSSTTRGGVGGGGLGQGGVDQGGAGRDGATAASTALQRQQVLVDLHREANYPHQALQRMAAAAGPGLALEQVLQAEQRLALSGRARSAAEILGFMARLDEGGWMVRRPSWEQETKTADGEHALLRFQLDIEPASTGRPPVAPTGAGLEADGRAGAQPSGTKR